MPIFQSGRGNATVEAALAVQRQAELAYRSGVLQALREVADSLVATTQVRDLIAQNDIRTNAAAETLRLQRMRYRAGVVSYIEVLDAERQPLRGADRSCALEAYAAAVVRRSLSRARRRLVGRGSREADGGLSNARARIHLVGGYLKGSIPCALITGMATGPVRNSINCVAASGALEFTPTPATNVT